MSYIVSIGSPSKYWDCSTFLFPFASLCDKHGTPTLAECRQTAKGLRGWLPITSSPRLYGSRRVDLISLNPIHHKIGTRSLCRPAWWAYTVSSGETLALERVLLATAQYSICGWSEICKQFAPSTSTSRSYAHKYLKAGESNQGGLQDMSREEVYPC